MDYLELVEKYVLEAWERGEATPAIKAQLVAKRWPPEMVETVIDRLVKKRVAAAEGEKKAVDGPNLWSQPTWPQENEGWQTTKTNVGGIESKLASSNVLKTAHKRKFSAMIQENSGLSSTPLVAAAPLEPVQTELPKMTVNQEKKPEVVSETASSESLIAQGTAEINQELDKVLASLQPERAPVETVEKMSRETVVASLQAREEGHKKLPQKLQESRNLRSEDEKIQLRALIFLGLLFFVIILALIWHFFVIK